MQPRPKIGKKSAWRHSTNYVYDFEKDIKRTKGTCLSNAQIARIHVLPRSYDERVDKSLHSCGFKYPTTTGDHFKEATMEMQTKDGKERL